MFFPLSLLKNRENYTVLREGKQQIRRKFLMQVPCRMT